MIRNNFLSVALLFGAGCAAVGGEPPALPPDHPANPGAPESTYSPPPNLLGAGTSPGELSPPRNFESSPGAVIKLDSVPEGLRKSLEEILGAYERIRALLAADKVEGIPEIAGMLEQTARSLSDSAPDTLLADLKTIEKTAQQLGHAEHVGLEAARKTFGDLSRSAIRLSAAVPGLVQTRKVFKCLMLNKGYAKWIQTGPTVSNPYLGKEMLECGNESDWKE